MITNSPKLIYLSVFALLSFFIFKLFINSSSDIFTPSGSLKKVVKFLKEADAFENELVSLLKLDPFNYLTQKEVEPIEEKMSKENQEIQMYLNEFSPTDPLIVKDFEEAAKILHDKIEILPIRAQPTLDQVQRIHEATNLKYSHVLKKFNVFKSEISKLEEIGIPLSVKLSEAQKSLMENYDPSSAVLMLNILHKHFLKLEDLKQKINPILGHSAFPKSYGISFELETLLSEHNSTEDEIVVLIKKCTPIIKYVYPGAENQLSRIQEHIQMLQQKYTFWRKEWNERISDLHKQYQAFIHALKSFKESVMTKSSSYVITEL